MPGFVIFFLGMLVVGVGTAVIGRSVSSERRREAFKRALEARTTTAIAALREGEPAKIRGVVTAREPLLTSPVGGRTCVGYGVVIVDGAREGDQAIAVVRRQAWQSFLVTDGTGVAAVEGPVTVLVDPADGWSVNLPWNDLPSGAQALLKEDKVRLKELFGIARTFRFQETLLKVGDRVTVIGRPSLEIDPAGRGFQREPPRLAVLRGTPWEPVTVADDDEPAA